MQNPEIAELTSEELELMPVAGAGNSFWDKLGKKISDANKTLQKAFKQAANNRYRPF